MAYQIYLTDGLTSAELDTEDIETKSIFALVELQDVGTKRNNIQTLTFKGTDANNQAFGHYFDFGRTTDLSDANRLFFNYNPIRAVKVIVYEDTSLIFIGDLRVTTIDVDTNNVVLYNCAVTTSLSILKNVLSDKYLRDLDFTFMRHRYCWDTISNSWVDNDNAPELYDVATDVYSQTTQGYGVGYCYPLADYGYRFNADDAVYAGSVTVPAEAIVSLRNLKPAVFVKQYFDSIFSQPELNGFTYEIRGGTGFTSMFNQVVIPETNEVLQDSVTGFTTTQEPTTYPYNKYFYVASYPNNVAQSLLTLNTTTQPSGYFTNYVLPIGLGFGDYGLEAQRAFTTSVKVEVRLNINNIGTGAVAGSDSYVRLFLILIKANGTTDYIGGYRAVTPPSTAQLYVFELNAANVSFNIGDKVAVLLESEIQIAPGAGSFDIPVDFNFDKLTVSVPGTTSDTFYYNAAPTDNCTVVDLYTPKAPTNIKQLDFLKSIINQFNFIVYTENTNYKHIIFEPYDSYYYRANAYYLTTNALDWTTKIDYTGGLTIKSNLELPKSYLFTYKSDDDYLNSFYKTKFNEIYGQFAFNDALGLTAEKKVELLFSPTPMYTFNNTMKPLYYKVENNIVKPTKINPRIVYYNGYKLYDNKSGGNYFGYEEIGTTGITITTRIDEYPQISNYYLVDAFDAVDTTLLTGYTVVNDIHFNQPKEIYFSDVNNQFLSPLNSYQNYYITQVSDLSSEQVIFVECSVYLSPLDIANLDLSVPVWINTGVNNGAYFKVINVEYENKDLTSKVTLQKILL
jgi:hypothetical protein